MKEEKLNICQHKTFKITNKAHLTETNNNSMTEMK